MILDIFKDFTLELTYFLIELFSHCYALFASLHAFFAVDIVVLS